VNVKSSPLVNISLAAVLGQLVRTEREARGLSQKALASRAGLHPVGLSKFERGAHQDVGVATLSRLANALSQQDQIVRAGDLMSEAERIRTKLLRAAQQGTLPAPYQPNATDAAVGVGAVVAGAALAALIVWLASREE